ncbi:unnamed protein product [Durusdinium trenchii]|uniref:Phospholipid/glycerol acyltransferase domain-containing protein n=2 Tax=Durusdinium trenchii TaxID=1381693 RepID=A0ABP0QZZ1_9DINO
MKGARFCAFLLLALCSRQSLNLVGQLGAWVTAPYRFVRLASVTKELAAEAKTKAKELAEQSSRTGGGAAKTLKEFLPAYMRSHVIARTPVHQYRELLNTTLNVLLDSIFTEKPFDFQPYHQAVRGPDLDFYAWGNDFFRSMIKWRHARVEGLEQLQSIKETLAKGDNVVLMANHQTEADPQVLSLLLQKEGYEELAEKCIFVAGHKVTTDRLAIPFSKGRYLLSIFSKKYLDEGTEEEQEAKAERNKKTISEMQRLMKEGGHIFWVAPSGGRDRRRAETGRFGPAEFDASSVGLFLLLAQKAGRGDGPTTHFMPLAMWTHRLVPPPEDAKASVGESRSAQRAAVGLSFGQALDVKKEGGRKKFPPAMEKRVNELYDGLDQAMP